MKIMTIRMMSVLLLLAVINSADAQLTQARTAMENLYKIYDSTPYISFDVKYTYSSDTLYNDYTHDELTGTYTMSGRKAKFSIAGVEYMQNDSFFIAAYTNDKIIVLSNARRANSGSYMPLRSAIDSLLEVYADHYSINVKDSVGDSTGYIRFTKTDSLAMFHSFAINFDKINNCITSLEYDFYEPFIAGDSSDLSKDVYGTERLRKMRIEFVRYRFDNFSEDLYEENNYIWFEDGIPKAVAKLEGYKVYDAR